MAAERRGGKRKKKDEEEEEEVEVEKNKEDEKKKKKEKKKEKKKKKRRSDAGSEGAENAGEEKSLTKGTSEDNGGGMVKRVGLQKQQREERRRKKLTRMHRASFCEYKPRGVVSLAAHACGGNATPLFYVAVAREGGEIEMWLTERAAAAAAAAAAGGDADRDGKNNEIVKGDRNEEKKRYKKPRSLRNGSLPTREKMTSTVIDRHWTKDGADISSIAFVSDGNDVSSSSTSDEDSVTLVASTLSGELYAWKEDNRRGRKSTAAIDAGGGAIWGLAVTSDERFLRRRRRREERQTRQQSNGNGMLTENGNGDHDNDDDDNDSDSENATEKQRIGNGVRTRDFDDEDHRNLIAIACDDGGVRVFACCRSFTNDANDDENATTTSSSTTELRLVRALPKVNGKTLCCEWLPTTRFSDTDDDVACIAFGSSEGIVHIWDYHNAIEINRITIGGGSAGGVSGRNGTAACVWSVAAIHTATTANVVIAAGTSDGVTSFWDTRFGTMLASFRNHEAPVVSVVAEGRNVFSSGVDNRICMFTLVTEDGGGDGLLNERVDADATGDDTGSGGKGRIAIKANGNDMCLDTRERVEKWAYLGYQRPHSHQVRSLALSRSGKGSAGGFAPPTLFSGGAEGCVYVFSPGSFLNAHPRVMCSMPTPPSLVVVEGPSRRNGRKFGGGELLLCQQQNSLDLWQLGFSRVDAATFEGDGEHDVEGAPVDLAAAPSHLARVRSSSPSRMMLASAISRDGATIAYSDSERCCVLHVEYHSAAGTRGSGGECIPDTLKIKSLSKDTRLPTIPASRCLSLPPSRHESQLLLAMVHDGAVWVIDLQERELMHVFSGFLGRCNLHVRDGSSERIGAAENVASDATPGGDDEDNVAAAANLLLPCPSTTAVSPDGQWLAVASLPSVGLRPSTSTFVDGTATTALATRDGNDAGGVRIAVLSLEGLITHTLIRVSNCITVTSMAFTHAGDVLAVATLAHDVFFFSVESGQLCRRFPGVPTGIFSTASLHADGAMKQKMRSVIKGMCFSPTPGSASALMFTDDSIVYKNFLMPVVTKRAHNIANGSEVIPAGTASANVAHERVLPLEHPCLFVQYLSGDDALLVERPWASALLSLPTGSLPARTRTFAQ